MDWGPVEGKAGRGKSVDRGGKLKREWVEVPVGEKKNAGEKGKKSESLHRMLKEMCEARVGERKKGIRQAR